MSDNVFDVLPGAADVVIVGLGPVGKMLAIQLGRHGHSVVAVDRNAANYPLPRAVTHCSEVARILQSIGLGPDAIPGITEPFDDMYRWRNGDGAVLLEVDWSGHGESGWHNTYFFHQPDLDEALDDVLAGLPSVTVMRSCQATGLTQNSHTATVVVESATDGDQAAITADWVIGADGANSTIRRLLGIEWHEEEYFSDWLVVDVKFHDGKGFPRVAAQLCDPSRPSTMVPAGPGRRRWEFMRLPDESPDDLGRSDKAWELLAPFDITPDNAELERHSVYTFAAACAQQWRQGCVFLAGDAAHLMPPFAGQGLAAGLRDAQNLSWKMAAVLRGVAGEKLLDTYGPERRPHAAAFTRFAVDLGRIVCITDPHAATVRDHRMIAQRHGRSSPATPPHPQLGPGLHVSPHGGVPARQGRIRAAGADHIALFDDFFSGAGAVITRTTDTLDAVDPQIRTLLRALDIAPVALSGPAEHADLIDDVDGVYRRWLDELATDTVVIRPDFYLFGCARAEHTAALLTSFVAATGATIPRRGQPKTGSRL